MHACATTAEFKWHMNGIYLLSMINWQPETTQLLPVTKSTVIKDIAVQDAEKVQRIMWQIHQTH